MLPIRRRPPSTSVSVLYLSYEIAAADITPALVHFALVPPEMQAQGRRLTVEIDATEIRMGF